MIRGYSDHAANERTFLAWVRTAIAVMAFGFLVEKFDLFLEVAAPSLSGRALSLPAAVILAGRLLICSRPRVGKSKAGLCRPSRRANFRKKKVWWME